MGTGGESHLTDAYFTYTTQQGDTFDILALDAWNDEAKSHWIIQDNPDHAHVLVFDAGIDLKIRVVDPSAASTLPPWKR